jgi:ribulose-phosphate 3-epimerase
MRRLELSPSILTADFGRLREEIRSVTPHVDWFHLDVMDGHYVDNITFGTGVVEVVRASCDLPLHVHLMISRPLQFVRRFADAGAARISFHPEADDDPGKVVDAIRSAGAGAGIAVHPDVGLAAATEHLSDLEVVLIMSVRPGFGGQAFLDWVVPKITEAKELVRSEARIEVDGGIKTGNVARVVHAGADIVVCGSAIFDGRDPALAAERMRAELDRLQADGPGPL